MTTPNRLLRVTAPLLLLAGCGGGGGGGGGANLSLAALGTTAVVMRAMVASVGTVAKKTARRRFHLVSELALYL
ncbi:MAG: hypothetical protein EOP80_18665, partial [Variovorax sp.]